MDNITLRFAPHDIEPLVRVESEIDDECPLSIDYLAPGRARSFSIHGAVIEVAAIDDRQFECRVRIAPPASAECAVVSLAPAISVESHNAASVAQAA